MEETLSSNATSGLAKSYFYIEPDPRVENWLFMSSPWPTIYLIIAYVAIVTVIGPWFMKNRKAYDLRNTLVVYSAAQMLFALWLFMEAGMAGWFTNYSWTCQPIDRSNSETALRMARVWWFYYMSKFFEFFDTFFFILRKKSEHVSALHVYHHAVMPLIWVAVKFMPGGHFSFFVLINTFVHVVMYTYYTISAMGPAYAKYIWWKKYITMIQLIQFGMGIIHAFQLFYRDCDTGFPKRFLPGYIVYALFFIFLFSDFYKSTYKKNEKSPPSSAPESSQVSSDTSPVKGKKSEKGKSKDNVTEAALALIVAIVWVITVSDASLKPNMAVNLVQMS